MNTTPFAQWPRAKARAGSRPAKVVKRETVLGEPRACWARQVPCDDSYGPMWVAESKLALLCQLHPEATWSVTTGDCGRPLVIVSWATGRMRLLAAQDHFAYVPEARQPRAVPQPERAVPQPDAADDDSLPCGFNYEVAS